MKSSRYLHWYAVVVAFSTLLLIFAGGLVTSTGSGLSVPDWPLSHGQVFPEMKGGVAYEHGHRMLASLVGLLTILLASWLWRREPRRWVRVAGGLAVITVIAQGVLGGATVLMRLPLALSVGHAALAQLFLCLTVAIALATSPNRQTREIGPARRPVRVLGVITALLIYLQILFGALTRHTGAGLSIPDFPLSYGRLIPPYFSTQVLYNYLHRIGGLVVLAFVVWLLLRVYRASTSDRSLRFPAVFLTGSLVFQIILGGVTIWSRRAPVLTSLHVVCGALVLAACVWLTMSSFGTVQERVEAAA